MMTKNQKISAYLPGKPKEDVICTVPNTYQKDMDRQTTHPSCGFYAAAYVLNCLTGSPKWTNETLFELAKKYPLRDDSKEKLTVIGEVFHPRCFAEFINTCERSILSAACQPFHPQTINRTIRLGGYILAPFEVINEKGGSLNGFPNANVKDGDPPHAHWCVIAGYSEADETKLLAKHWGKNYLFDINDLRQSNKGIYPPHTNPGLTEERGKGVTCLRGQIITILPEGGHDDSPQDQKGCSC